jgi:K+-transporting ATPase ATPase C chain
MQNQLRPALISLMVWTLITGVIYPLIITGLAQVIFPDQANGSLLIGQDGQPLGSALIGQSFDDPQYFWGRLSATSPYPYNAFNPDTLTASSGSNYGPLHPALLAAAQARIEALHTGTSPHPPTGSTTQGTAAPGQAAPVPVDLVTASASGLDPHISPAAAERQVGRVARLRGLDEATVRQLVAQFTEGRQFGLLGEPRVNVLQLNLALDALKPTKSLSEKCRRASLCPPVTHRDASPTGLFG